MGNMDLNNLKGQSKKVLKELISNAKLNLGDIVIIGCSTSEVIGKEIGTCSNINVAQSLFDGFIDIINENGLFLAAQCCEHLNRAVVVEREVAEKLNLEIVNVVPGIKAGGAFSTVCWNNLKKPVAVEKIKADCGIDIGGTLIGMHIKSVVVPVVTSIRRIGDASVICARRRPKFIGGERAKYDSNFC